MKKLYILTIVAFAFSLTVNAQIIDDNMESYAQGPLFQDHWSNWSGVAGDGSESIIITIAQGTPPGFLSGLIDNGGVQDAILDLTSQIDGIRTLNFNMYIPAGKTGYYNFQESLPAGTNWALHIDFNGGNLDPGVATFREGNAATVIPGSFTYPEDTWFLMSHEMDLDNDLIVVRVDGVEAYSGQLYSSTGEIAGVDFFSIDTNNEYYIDDVFHVDGLLGVDDFSADVFSVYPNPVRDVLNISSKAAVESITVYDILGKVVLQAQPNAISPSINMGALASGAYLVNVTIGNASKTIKVIK